MDWYGYADEISHLLSPGSIARPTSLSFPWEDSTAKDSMIEDLFDLIGGRSTIAAATELFYDKVLQDDNLRHFFQGVDMAHLRSRQAMFISVLLGGRVYTGRNIREAHAWSKRSRPERRAFRRVPQALSHSLGRSGSQTRECREGQKTFGE